MTVDKSNKHEHSATKCRCITIKISEIQKFKVIQNNFSSIYKQDI